MKRTAALLLVLASCAPHHTAGIPKSASWPMYQLSANHNAVLPRANFRYAWKFDSGSQINGGLAIVGDTLYVDTFGDELIALNARRGNVIWRSRADNVLMSTPIVADGAVFVGSGTSERLPGTPPMTWGRVKGDAITAFSASTGAKQWAFHTIGEDMPSSAYTAGALIFANGDFHAYALDSQSGGLRWKRRLTGLGTMSSATIARGRVYFSVCSYTFPNSACETYAVNPISGHVYWHEPYGNSDASPTYGDGRVYVSNFHYTPDANEQMLSFSTDVAALDAQTGTLRWLHRMPKSGIQTYVGTAEVAIAGTYDSGSFYQAITSSNELASFDARTGKIRWSFTSMAPVKMSPVIRGGLVYFGDTAGIFYAVDAKTGKIVRTHPMSKPFSCSAPVIIGDTLFVANGSSVIAWELGTDI